MNESDPLTLVNAGDEEVVSQEEGEREGGAAGGEGGGCYCASTIAIEAKRKGRKSSIQTLDGFGCCSCALFADMGLEHMRAHRAWYVYYCRTYEKAVSGGGEREKGGHVLRDTTSRGLWTLESALSPCLVRPGRRLPVRVWPPHWSLVFGECAFPPVSLGPAGDCPCKD